jgi:hypothetical protein
MTLQRALGAAIVVAARVIPASAPAADNWVTSWVASAQGPYPIGTRRATKRAFERARGEQFP